MPLIGPESIRSPRSCGILRRVGSCGCALQPPAFTSIRPTISMARCAGGPDIRGCVTARRHWNHNTSPTVRTAAIFRRRCCGPATGFALKPECASARDDPVVILPTALSCVNHAINSLLPRGFLDRSFWISARLEKEIQRTFDQLEHFVPRPGRIASDDGIGDDLVIGRARSGDAFVGIRSPDAETQCPFRQIGELAKEPIVARFED